MDTSGLWVRQGEMSRLSAHLRINELKEIPPIRLPDTPGFPMDSISQPVNGRSGDRLQTKDWSVEISVAAKSLLPNTDLSDPLWLQDKP
ncbi:hypothetical protein BTVI_137700 [Pitangus sulphuratus]|nr:hypothetical protein BTVI_137700 [Pitangus sulphuratus]